MTTTRPTTGAWIDDAPQLVSTEAFWDDAHRLGIEHGSIMVEDVGGGWDPSDKWDEHRLELVGDLARARGISIGLIVWPQPDAHWLARAGAELDAMLLAARAIALEVDDESNTTEAKCHAAGTTMQAFGDAMAKFFEERRTRARLERVEATTFAMHPENGARAQIAKHADRTYAQAYAVLMRTGSDGHDAPVPWNSSLGPGEMQRTTLDRALQVPRGPDGRPHLAVGLAAYDQVWPGKKGEDAMRVSYDAALTYSPAEVRWWSSKWIWGAHANGYARRFLELLAATRAGA